jgi:hypothetical protein
LRWIVTEAHHGVLSCVGHIGWNPSRVPLCRK